MGNAFLLSELPPIAKGKELSNKAPSEVFSGKIKKPLVKFFTQNKLLPSLGIDLLHCGALLRR